jgi:hypothetical protein
MVENETYAIRQNEANQQHAAQRPMPVQESEPPPATPAPSQDDLVAAARQKNLEQNDRYAESNSQGRGAQQQALIEAAESLAPKAVPNLDQQLQQQKKLQQEI